MSGNKTKLCPYCREEAKLENGVCAFCRAAVSESDLVMGIAPPKPEQPPKVQPKQYAQAQTELTVTAATVAQNLDRLSGEQALKFGLVFFGGGQVKRNPELAFKLFTRATLEGEVEAWFYLGECYDQAFGTPADPDKALLCYRRGAELKDVRCQNALKLRYGASGADAASGGAGAYANGFTDLVERLRKNVLEVHCANPGAAYGSAGAGFIVTGNLVVTNAHVVLDGGEPYGRIYVSADDGIDYPVQLLAYDARRDIAVCGFTGALPGGAAAERLKLVSCLGIKAGTDVFTIGNPKNMGLRLSKGVVSREAENGAKGPCLCTDMSINSGNSGGPLFVIDGSVAGMMTYSVLDEAGGRPLGDISFAVAADSVMDVIKKIM